MLAKLSLYVLFTLDLDVGAPLEVAMPRLQRLIHLEVEDAGDADAIFEGALDMKGVTRQSLAKLRDEFLRFERWRELRKQTST